MKRLLLAILPVMGVTACVPTILEITEPPAGVSFSQNAPMDRIRDKVTSTTIRTYQMVKDEDGEETRVEVGGARCNLKSDHLSASVVTPQQVQLPKYDQIPKIQGRGVPPSILVSCSANGLNGQQLLAAKPGEILSGSGNLVVDLVLIAGSAAAAATADWRFEPSVAVVLE